MKQEIQRQAFHLIGGSAIALVIYYLSKEIALLLLIGFFAIFSFISYTHSSIKSMNFIQDILTQVQRENEKHIPLKGALSFLLGTILAAIIFLPFEKTILLGAIIVLTFGDGFSTIIGKLAGKNRVVRNKTIEGTIGGIVAATLTLLTIITFEKALATAIFGMLAEYIPVNDAYTIPLISGIILLLIL